MAMESTNPNDPMPGNGAPRFHDDRHEDTTPGAFLSPRGICAMIFRHRGKMIFFFIAVVGGAVVLMLLTPPVYQSNAKMLSRVGRESLAQDPSVVGPTVSVSQSRESEINSELAILRSRDLLGQVVDTVGVESLLRPPRPGTAGATPLAALGDAAWLRRLGLTDDVPRREKAIEKLDHSLLLEVDGKSNIIDVSLNAYEPEVAHQALDELLRLYLKRHIEVYGSQAPPHFFQDQTAALAAALTQKENELGRFRQEQGITLLDPQREGLLSQISTLQNQIAEASSQMGSSEAKIGGLSKSLAALNERIELNRVTGKTNYAADNLKNRLAELRTKESDLMTRYSGDSRILANLREQITTLEAQLEREEATHTEVTMGLDTNHQALLLALENERAELKGQTARKQALSAALAQRKSELSDLSSQEFTMSRLERERKALEADYLHSRENMQRALVSSALDAGKIASVSIVQPATVPYKPVKPRKLLLLGLALFLGLCGALALGFLADAWDESLRSPREAQLRLGAPVLAAFTVGAYESCRSSQARLARMLAHRN